MIDDDLVPSMLTVGFCLIGAGALVALIGVAIDSVTVTGMGLAVVLGGAVHVLRAR